MKMEMEMAVMEIISRGGDARSSCLKAVRSARNEDFTEADNLLKRGEENLLEAHKVQTMLIQSEIRGEQTEITLLMIHAQDHLMNAITFRDMAIELIELMKRVQKLEG